MAQKTTPQLTSEFEDGDSINSSNFYNILDSTFNLEDTGSKSISGNVRFIDGDVSLTTGSLKVTESISRGDWEDGYLGNSEFISLLPGDFTMGNLVKTIVGQSVGGYIDGTYTPNAPGPPHHGGAAVSPSTEVGPVHPSTGISWFASKIIPLGYEAYAFGLSGSNTSNWVTAHSSSISVGTQTFVYNISTTINSEEPFLPFVVGDGYTYVTLNWQTSTAGTDELWGGKIYIRRI